MSKLDPRLNAYRADLAAAGLRGRVEAGRFVEGEPAQVCRGVANLHRRPAADAPVDTQLLFGEPVTLYERADGWAWVQSRQDGYVGYVAAAALGAVFAEPGHSVAVLRSHVFPKPDLKAPPLAALPMTSAVAVTGAQGHSEGRFSRIAFGPGGSGWVYSAHLAAAGSVAPDYTATALQFLGVPYLWGGKTSEGLDCSGLIQVALARAGVPCPRDTDMQAARLGKEIAQGLEDHRPAYGDILYMPGHVAIALDERRVVHANAHHMLTTIEPLADLLDRVAAECGRPADQVITSVRRPA